MCIIETLLKDCITPALTNRAKRFSSKLNHINRRDTGKLSAAFVCYFCVIFIGFWE
uniref:Uncharacterized protein n=1 Tax=uncultured marine virus TaxID=186617 RepID=A0A0F7L405_9VIRU|nr:hypothetical protein VvAW1_00029c [uncultured marine virus]